MLISLHTVSSGFVVMGNTSQYEFISFAVSQVYRHSYSGCEKDADKVGP